MEEHSDCFRNSKSTQFGSTHGYFIRPSRLPEPRLLPIFSLAKHPCFKDLLIPLHHQIRGVIEANPLVNNSIASWEEKKNVLFWRGSTTGGKFHPKSHRIALVRWAKEFAQRYPERVCDYAIAAKQNESLCGTSERFSVDIGFHRLHDPFCGPDSCAEINKTFGLKKPISFAKIQEFKYLIVVDGQTWPDRLQTFLATNSIVLYNGIFIDWYMWRLEPWVHYVPFRGDYSDLEETVEFLEQNGALAKRIIRNANRLMQQVQKKETMGCYTALMLLEYANLVKADDAAT